MNKVDKLDNIQLVVSELVSSIKQDIHNEEVVTNESISYLTRRVEKLNSCDSQFFTAGYNILVLNLCTFKTPIYTYLYIYLNKN